MLKDEGIRNYGKRTLPDMRTFLRNNSKLGILVRGQTWWSGVILAKVLMP